MVRADRWYSLSKRYIESWGEVRRRERRGEKVGVEDQECWGLVGEECWSFKCLEEGVSLCLFCGRLPSFYFWEVEDGEPIGRVDYATTYVTWCVFA